MRIKKCNSCKRELQEISFTRKDKIYSRCNECSENSSNKKTCRYKGCFKLPTYNYEGEKQAIYCKEHKEINMVDVKHKKCIYKGCSVRPIYNYKGEKQAIYCKEHKELNMVNVIDKKCIYEKCDKQPSYNYEGETTPIYCNEHKEENMVYLLIKKCIYKECKKIPVFNYINEKNPIYCKEHKEENMVNVKDKKCINCNKQPSYNYEGKINPIYCKEHKEEEMVNVVSKTCIYKGCNKIPNYNYEGEKKAIYCKEHKEENMVNKDKKCVYKECRKYPSYNYKGEKPLYCKEHKEEEMVNVVSKTCIYKGCNKIPNYNYEGEKKAIFCKDHKEENMVDIKHNFCIYPECKTRANYGYCCSSITYCHQHKLNFMISKTKKICIGNSEEECKEYATYGKTEPIHCEEHSLKEELCWLVNKCKNCNRDNEILNKEGLCGLCCDIPFYNEIQRIRKVKETTMIRYIKDNVNILNKVKELPCDKIVNRECNLYRPDLPYHCGSFILIIECDEEQHKKYNWESCSLNRSLQHAENKRMYEIMLAYEGIPCLFLRWNPDNFKVKGEICKKYNINKRLEILKKWVEYCIKLDINKLESLVQYKKLFYDDYDEADIQFTSIYEEELL